MFEQRDFLELGENSRFWKNSDIVEGFKKYYYNTNPNIVKPNFLTYNKKFLNFYNHSLKIDQKILGLEPFFSLKSVFKNTSFEGNSKAKVWRKKMVESGNLIVFYSLDYDLITRILDYSAENYNCFVRLDMDKLEQFLKIEKVINLSVVSVSSKNGSFNHENLAFWSDFYNVYLKSYYPKVCRFINQV